MSISVLLVWTVILGVAHVGITVGAMFYLNSEMRSEVALDVASLRAETIAMQQNTQAQLDASRAVANNASDHALAAQRTATATKGDLDRHFSEIRPKRRR